MIELYNGDCLEILPTLEENSVDLVLIDPPYEQDFHGGKTNKGRGDDYNRIKAKIDFMNNGFPYEKVFKELLRILKIPNLIIFCSNKQISKLMTYFEQFKLTTTLLIWRKTNACPLGGGKYISDLEYVIYVRGKKAPWNHEAPTSIKYKCKDYPFVAGRKKQHPAEKPLDLIKEFVKLHSLPGQVVLDCYMGAGTTGVACKALGRNFIGIEIEKKYYDIARTNLSN